MVKRPSSLYCSLTLILLVVSFGYKTHSAIGPDKKYDEIDKPVEECIKLLTSPCCSNDIEYLNCGNAYLSMRDYDRAIKAYSKAIQLNVRNVMAYKGRGNCYYMKRHYDRAIDDYTKAVDLNPKFAAAYKDRGNSYANRRLYVEAIADYAKAIELNPKFANAYLERGKLQYALGSYDEAIADFTKVIILNPKDAQIYTKRGNAYDDKGLYDEAIADYTKAISLSPTYAAAYSERGIAQARRNLYDEALLDFEKAIDLDPKFVDAYKGRGGLWYIKGLYDKAIVDFNKVIELAPEYEYGYLRLINAVWLSKGSDEAAMNMLRRHVSLHRSDEWLRTISKYYIGIEGLDEQSVLKEAKKDSNEKTNNERLCEAYYYLGVKRLASGDKGGAADYFTESMKTNVKRFWEYEESKVLLLRLRNGEI